MAHGDTASGMPIGSASDTLATKQGEYSRPFVITWHVGHPDHGSPILELFIDTLRNLLPFACLSLCNASLCTLVKRPFGETICQTLLGASLLMIAGQFLCSTFLVPIVLLVIGAVACVPIILRTSNMSEVRSRVLSPGFFAFLAVFVLVCAFDAGRRFSAWDEMSHWGVMVKEMLRNDAFYTDPASTLMVHKEYPPFIPTFEMLWCKLAGGYSESVVSVALHTLTLSLLVVPIFEQREDRTADRPLAVLKAVLAAATILMLAVLFDKENVALSIYTDVFTSALFAYSLLLVVRGDVYGSRFSFASFVLSLVAMIATKQIGIAFILLSCLAYLLVWLFGRKGQPRSYKSLLLRTAIVGIAVLGCNAIWSGYAHGLGEYGQFDLGGISLSELSSIISGKGTGLRAETFDAFKNALFTRPLCQGHAPRILSSYAALFPIVLCLLAAVAVYARDASVTRKAVCLGITFAVGTVCYALTMCVLYLFCFKDFEMLALASYERYMASYVLGELLVIAGFFVQVQRRQERWPLEVLPLAIGSIALLAMFLPHDIGLLLPQRMRGDAIVGYEPYAERIRSQTEPGSHVAMAAEERESIQFFTHYLVTDRYVDWDHARISTLDYSDQGLKEEVLEDILNNDYLYVVNATDALNDAYSSYNGGEPFKDDTVYRIDRTQRGRKFVPTSSTA